MCQKGQISWSSYSYLENTNEQNGNGKIMVDTTGLMYIKSYYLQNMMANSVTRIKYYSSEEWDETDFLNKSNIVGQNIIKLAFS